MALIRRMLITCAAARMGIAPKQSLRMMLERRASERHRVRADSRVRNFRQISVRPFETSRYNEWLGNPGGVGMEKSKPNAKDSSRRSFLKKVTAVSVAAIHPTLIRGTNYVRPASTNNQAQSNSV